jgi:hypothetical protein
MQRNARPTSVTLDRSSRSYRPNGGNRQGDAGARPVPPASNTSHETPHWRPPSEGQRPGGFPEVRQFFLPACCCVYDGPVLAHLRQVFLHISSVIETLATMLGHRRFMQSRLAAVVHSRHISNCGERAIERACCVDPKQPALIV